MAAGLANPSKQIGEGVVASSVVTPKLFIYTDGGFADVEGFSLGNLEPEVVVIGPPPPPYSAADRGSRPGRRQSRRATLGQRRRSWRSRPGETKTSPRSISSSAAFTTSGPKRSRPRLSFTGMRPANRARKPARRRDRAQAPRAERPVVQVRPARHRA